MRGKFSAESRDPRRRCLPLKEVDDEMDSLRCYTEMEVLTQESSILKSRVVDGREIVRTRPFINVNIFIILFEDHWIFKHSIFFLA